MLNFAIFLNKKDSIANSIANVDSSQHDLITPQSENITPTNDSINYISVEQDTVSLKSNKHILFNDKNIEPNNLSLTDTVDHKVLTPDNSIKLKEPHNFFSFNLNSDSFDYKYNSVFIEKNNTHHLLKKELNYRSHHYYRSHFNWALILGLVSITLLLILKTYYQKFFNQVINALFNKQLAEKMFREKNILLRRAFFLLNVNFVIIISLFILLLAANFGFNITKSNLIDYFIIFSAVVSALLLRYLIFYMTGTLFVQLPVVLEYLHNKYIYNKNIGIALIPLVFISIYVSPSISKIILISSLILILIVAVIKLIRGFQIILKNGVLLFYTILYLCTLELLPLVLGSKIINSLR